MKVNNFVQCLEESLNPDITTVLDELYQRMFPDVHIRRTDNKNLQKAGIDVILNLTLARKTIYIDEKIRTEYYGDILLEEYSNYDKRVLGWLESNNKRTDFILYAVIPMRLAYFLPYIPLRHIYLQHKTEWLKSYSRIFAPNDGYRTSNIPVPWEILSAKLIENMEQIL